jgi:DNA gyrase subunit A
VPVRDVPVQDKPAKGAPVGEPVVAAFAVGHGAEAAGSSSDERTLFLATAQGGVKRVRFAEVGELSRVATVAALDDGDRLVAAVLLGGEEHVSLATKGGKVIRFAVDEVRVMGRPAGTIAGLKVQPGDEVVWAGAAPAEGALVALSSGAFAKRTSWGEYPVQGRGGQGVRGFKVGGKAGDAVGAWASVLDDADELWLGTSRGATSVVRAGDVAVAARDSAGARLSGYPAQAVVAVVVRPAGGPVPTPGPTAAPADAEAGPGPDGGADPTDLPDADGDGHLF